MGCKVQLVQEEQAFIEMWHQYDQQRLQIALHPEGPPADLPRLEKLRQRLQKAAEGDTLRDGGVYQPIGKAQIEVVSCKNILHLPHNCQTQI